MSQSWVCPGGHSGDERLPMPTCPSCGLPISYVVARDKALEPDSGDTLVGSSRKSSGGDDELRDLVFFDQPEVADVSSVLMETMQRPSDPPLSLEQTLQPPSTPATRHAADSSPPSWPSIFPVSEGSQDDTLQKLANDSSPPPTRIEEYDHGGPLTVDQPAPADGETLVKPTARPTGSAPMSGDASTIVSGYEILGLLGRGGMGVVYKARQLGLKRVVALKMILHGAHASPEDHIRFNIEAQSVAKLQHPNIVAIHDIGERDGRPYFSLEYLEGGSLQQRLKGDPLAPRAAANLLQTLARAMDYAHRHGIIHRDLKPANILIAEPAPLPLDRCTPKITDFGLAKRLQADDQQGHTGTEAVLGTPTYMAPEQAMGKTREVGPAADIYALGAILYDLLTGRPPFKGTTVLDTLQMVQLAEPVAPVSLNNKVPRDLQTICLKCLEKDPGKRYASAGELADDLQRFLDGKPIKAREVGFLERSIKWAKRHPAQAGLTAVGFLGPLLLAAVSLGAWAKVSGVNNQLTSTNTELTDTIGKLETAKGELEDREGKLKQALSDAQREKQNAQTAQAKAEAEELDAQDSFLRAQQSVEKLLGLVSDKLRNKPGTEKIREDILTEAIKVCRPFSDKHTANPASRLRAARALRLTADLHSRLYDNAAAEKSYREALVLYDQLIKEQPALKGADVESEAVESALQQWTQLERTDPEKATAFLGEVMKRLDALPAEKAAEPMHRRNRAVLLANRAIHHQNRANYDEAEKDYDNAAAELEKLRDLPQVPLELARVHVNRAAMYLTGTPGTERRQGDLAKAAVASERAVADLTRILGNRPEEMEAAVELGRAYTNLGMARAAQKGPSGATEVYESAVKKFDELHRQFPLYVDYKHLLAVSLGNLGVQYQREERPDRAREPLARGKRIMEDLVKNHADVPGYRTDLGRVCTSLGGLFLANNQAGLAQEPLQTAARYFEDAVRASPKNDNLRRDLSAVYQNLIICHDRQARTAAERKDWAKAEPHVRALSDIREGRVKLLPLLPASAPASERLERAGESLVARAELVGTLKALGRVSELRGDHRGAADTITRLQTLLPPGWPGFLESAALLSRCIALAEEDVALDEGSRAKAAERYGKRAMEILNALSERGVDVKTEIKGEDFAPLRRRATFRSELDRLAGASR